MSLLSLKHISKRYQEGRGQITVLDDVCLEIEEGDFVGIWGMRRSGKTTLLQVAAGRQAPSEGRVCFDGQDLAELSPDRRAKLYRRNGIGLITPDWRPERNKPVVDHVSLPLLSDGMSLREAREPAWCALERVGVVGCGYLPADRLSQGERMRVALAQALVHEPRLLFVDEPAVLLRPSEAVELYELLCTFGRDPELAIVIASEDVAPIRKARRMMSISDGKLRSMDQPGMLVSFPERTGRQRSRP